MKIREILEKTYEIKTADIAKGLPVGEKKLRGILKAIGAKPPKTGERGWAYEDVKAADLEKDITDFVKPRAATETAKASNSKSNDVSAEPSKQENNMDDEILALIKGTLKELDDKVYKGIYFEPDIAHFLDNIKHGNKSELVNKIMRKYLAENNLL